MTAATLLAGALADGADGLSSRDCWLCLAYLYAGVNSAATQLKNAIADGCDRLSDDDVLKCIAERLNSGQPVATAPVLTINSGDLSWTYSGTLPNFWVIQQSPTGFNPWTLYDTVPGGNNNESAVPAPFYYRMFGSVDGVIVSTGYSNTVNS